MKREAADLYEAVALLYELLSRMKNQAEMERDRDDVRSFVHKVSETYLNWAFEVDSAQLK